MLEVSNFNWRDLVDITIVSILLYQVIQLLRGTRAIAILSGLGLLTILYIISKIKHYELELLCLYIYF